MHGMTYRPADSAWPTFSPINYTYKQRRHRTARDMRYHPDMRYVYALIRKNKCRVAKNLEYSGNSLNLENSWNSQGILYNLREDYNK